MTRPRHFGNDVEFCAWIRGCHELQSDPDTGFGLSVSDTDLKVHRYITSIDGVGTREIQALMEVEVKTRRGKPRFAQMDTLSKFHAARTDITSDDGQIVRHFGVFLLILDGTSPDNSSRMWWGVLPSGRFIHDAKQVRYHVIDKQMLIDLLSFNIHPANLSKHAFRRHHKTSELLVRETTPLGFACDRRLVVRS